MVCTVLITIVISVVSAVWLYNWYKHRFWSSLGIIQADDVRFLAGNFGKVIKGEESMGERLKNIYDEIKQKGPFGGFYQFLEPGLMITDPKLIKSILIQDFDSFHSRGMYHNERDDPLGAHLVFLEGQKWKQLRHKLTPVYTTGKLKAMFPLMNECGVELVETLKRSSEPNNVLEFKDLMARYTTDVIGSCAMGVQCNSLKDPDAEFRRETMRVFRPRISFLLTILFATEFQNLAKMLRIKIVDKSAAKFFMRIVRETVEYREKNNINRNDVMQTLIKLKNKGKLDDDEVESDLPKDANTTDAKLVDDSPPLTLEQVAAEAFVFFVGGFETTSTAMSFLCYELALNQKIQENARKEIQRVMKKHNGVMSYDAIMEMEYLDRCISESLRKYPVLPLLRRMSYRPYTVRTADGTEKVIPTGTPILCSTLGLHRDPEYWPEPDTFDPERFTDEEKAKREKYAYLPFGDGPRNCIGMRFGLMQARVGIASLLHSFRLEACDKTEMKIKLDPRTFPTTAKGGIWLKVVPLESY